MAHGIILYGIEMLKRNISSECHLILTIMEMNIIFRQHIVGAVKFNIDDISDKSALLPRSIPNEEEFEAHIGKVYSIRHNYTVCI